MDAEEGGYEVEEPEDVETAGEEGARDTVEAGENPGDLGLID